MTARLIRFLLLLGLLHTASHSGWGQQAAPSSAGNPLQELHTALAGLDPTRITTGVLLNSDYAVYQSSPLCRAGRYGCQLQRL